MTKQNILLTIITILFSAALTALFAQPTGKETQKKCPCTNAFKSHNFPVIREIEVFQDLNLISVSLNPHQTDLTVCLCSETEKLQESTISKTKNCIEFSTENYSNESTVVKIMSGNHLLQSIHLSK